MFDDTGNKYLVRTLYLANFTDAVVQVAEQRHNPSDMGGLRNALKKLEMADQTLEKELNAYAAQNCDLVGFIQHSLSEHPSDLLVTAIFMRNNPD